MKILTAAMIPVVLVPTLALGAVALSYQQVSAEPVRKAVQSAGNSASDAYLSGRLSSAYSLSEQLRGFPIQIRVENSIVRLDGTLPSLVHRDLAVEIAESLEAVKQVHAQLNIDPAVEALAAAGDTHFAQAVLDASITARVKARLLWNSNTEGLLIGVDTRAGQVTLTGPVESKAVAALAVQIARNTGGVQKVEDYLMPRPA